VPSPATLQPDQGSSTANFPKSRLYLGGAVMVIGFLSPLSIPLVAKIDMPESWLVAISGFLLLGIPEVLMLIAVAIMGEAGYAYLRKRFLQLLRRYGPAERVSLMRHRIGVCMFVLPLLVGLMSPYLGDLLPWHAEYQLQIAIALDLLLLSSLIVLGGEFWDKLRGLFVHGSSIH